MVSWNAIFLVNPGVSYNPRPARIALILLKDVGVSDTTVIASAMLASVVKRDKLKRLETNLPCEVVELAVLAKTENPTCAKTSSDKMLNAASLIAMATHLDRARQLHRAKRERRLSVEREILEKTESYSKLASKLSPRLEVLLCAWKRRYETNRRL